MDKRTLKQTCVGIFELFIFIPDFHKHFSPTRSAAIGSFIFPLLLYPIAALVFLFNQEEEARSHYLILLHALISWGGLFLFYMIIYAVAVSANRREYFWQTINVFNGYAILTSLLLLPLFLGVLFLGRSVEEMMQYWIFFILVGLAYKSFILGKSLRLNIPLGGFLATLNLFIADVGFRLLTVLAPEDIV